MSYFVSKIGHLNPRCYSLLYCAISGVQMSGVLMSGVQMPDSLSEHYVVRVVCRDKGRRGLTVGHRTISAKEAHCRAQHHFCLEKEKLQQAPLKDAGNALRRPRLLFLSLPRQFERLWLDNFAVLPFKKK